MNWNREYHYYLIFGDTTPDYIPWETHVWTSYLYPILDKILLQSGFYQQTGVGSLQYIPKPGTAYFEKLKLGRLSWNAGDGNSCWKMKAGNSTIPFRIPCQRIYTKGMFSVFIK